MHVQNLRNPKIVRTFNFEPEKWHALGSMWNEVWKCGIFTFTPNNLMPNFLTNSNGKHLKTVIFFEFSFIFIA